MLRATVKVTWTLSPSSDVVSQHAVVVNETTGETIFDQNLSRNVTELTFDIYEKQDALVTIVANDGTNDSDPATLKIPVGDLGKPQPVSGLSWEITNVIDL